MLCLWSASSELVAFFSLSVLRLCDERNQNAKQTPSFRFLSGENCLWNIHFSIEIIIEIEIQSFKTAAFSLNWFHRVCVCVFLPYTFGRPNRFWKQLFRFFGVCVLSPFFFWFAWSERDLLLSFFSGIELGALTYHCTLHSTFDCFSSVSVWICVCVC